MNLQDELRRSVLDKGWQLPLRLATGAFVLNSGVSKGRADEPTAAQLHGFAAGTYPFLGKIDPKRFTQALSTAEIVIGTALLLVPVIPGAVAGVGLTGFAGGLLGLYLRTPGMREPGSLRPTEQGIPLAKDAWLAAIGVALVVGDLESRTRGSNR